MQAEKKMRLVYFLRGMRKPDIKPGAMMQLTEEDLAVLRQDEIGRESTLDVTPTNMKMAITVAIGMEIHQRGLVQFGTCPQCRGKRGGLTKCPRCDGRGRVQVWP